MRNPLDVLNRERAARKEAHGFEVHATEAAPPGEYYFINDGKIVGKIAPAEAPAAEAQEVNDGPR